MRRKGRKVVKPTGSELMDYSANHVGAENEAFAKAALGNGLRPP